jgi:hypothetical protein
VPWFWRTNGTNVHAWTQVRMAPILGSAMELIASEDFGKLRLHQFLKRGIRKVSNWEYQNDIWVGEVMRATSVLRLARDPEITRAVEISLSDLPVQGQTAMLAALALPLRKGMSAKEISALLGKPVKSYGFFPGRKHHEHKVGKSCRYTVVCTVLEPGGLVHVAVLRPRRD